MSKISQKLGGINKQKAGLIAIIAVILVALPMFVSSSKTHKIYVDNDATGTQDGSKSHPYKTISKAISKAKGKTEIHVDSGTYRENITIRGDIELYGEDRDDTIIDAASDNEAAVTMKDNTVINKFTVKGGSYGIKVKDKAKAKIVKCIVRANKKDGIRVESDGLRNDKMVSITDSTIKDNKWSGIYAQKRRLSIIDNDIKFNGKDGLDVAAGSRAWIADNLLYGNGGSGLKLAIDGSDIWTKSNQMNENHREGLEVSFGGVAGRVNISKSEAIGNDRYGIARVQDFPINANSENLWKRYLTQEANNNIIKNEGGNISVIIVRN